LYIVGRQEREPHLEGFAKEILPMRPTHWARTASGFASWLLVLTLTGCGDSAGPSNGSLTVTETSDVGAAMADEVDQAVASITTEGAAFGVVAGQSAALFMGPATGCATVDNTTDSDGDGAPDNATFTFALPACSFTGFRGGTLEITGTIAIRDPTPTGADFNYLATLSDFQFKLTAPNPLFTYTATRNGTRNLTGDAQGVSLSNNITVVRSVPGRADAMVSHNLLLSFTPASGQSLALGQPLPDGTFTKSGTFTWSRAGITRTFTVTTVTPLTWDSSCTTDRKISAGEIHGTLSSGGYVKTVWTACGQDPTRTFVPAA
jgi:hypothetical protein